MKKNVLYNQFFLFSVDWSIKNLYFFLWTCKELKASLGNYMYVAFI